jgi:hypothetical protein
LPYQSVTGDGLSGHAFVERRFGRFGGLLFDQLRQLQLRGARRRLLSFWPSGAARA